MNQQWNSGTYDSSMSFVSQFGESLIGLLQPQPGERILDWGSGTGDLAALIAQSGADVTGIDVSPEMVRAAQAKHPQLRFIQADAQHYVHDKPADAIFSNAALHWLQDADAAAASMASSLRSGGRLVCEFGGHGNIASVVSGLPQVFEAHGLGSKLRMPWYFPSIGQYTSLLEKHGFTVELALCFARPTPLEDGEQGFRKWLDVFANGILSVLTTEQRERILTDLEEQLRPLLFQDGRWVMDYRRIRVSAFKR
ncbi:methyltransferase type 11 [Paenibacillus yonginensis]|uniref:Methyltransferase type 11 n=1 Tax=Paenibacillus yonginensis TaxID=1462996 RepID=A0A1B1MWD7_9BACL|nr:methyltransferase domain-containing protein [Paenibacillus yonginensis]ANS73479.1 methyltransferase type 11 [Paenibacillus yonginensis]